LVRSTKSREMFLKSNYTWGVDKFAFSVLFTGIQG